MALQNQTARVLLMTKTRFYYSLFLAGLMLASVNANIQIQADLDRTQFMQYEPIDLIVTFQNRIGSSFEIQQGQELIIQVKDQFGSQLSSAKKINLPRHEIAPGGSKAYHINLAQMFRFSSLGRYHVKVMLKYGGSKHEVVISNQKIFHVAKGQELWSVRVGDSRDGTLRNVKLLSFDDSYNRRLYMQFEDALKNQAFKNIRLGEAILFKSPKVLMDKQNQAHIVYQSAVGIYRYLIFSSNGEELHQSFYKSTSSEVPEIMVADNYEVFVRGGVPYDPELEAKILKSYHYLSERPDPKWYLEEFNFKQVD